MILLLTAFALSDCEKKSTEISSKFPIIEKTAKDSTQPDYIRESAKIFEEILKGEKKVSKTEWIQASYDLTKIRNDSTISTYVEFLKSLENKVPQNLPTLKEYEAMKESSDRSEKIDNTISRVITLIGESIKDISLYNDPAADAEIAGILKRLNEKHGDSETGKKIMEFLNLVHGQGMTARSWGIKPWETPRREPEYMPPSSKP